MFFARYAVYICYLYCSCILVFSYQFFFLISNPYYNLFEDRRQDWNLNISELLLIELKIYVFTNLLS